MFSSLKNIHAGSMYRVKLDLAYKWRDDSRLPIWVGQAYTYYKRLDVAGVKQITWSADDAKRYAAQLSEIYNAISETALRAHTIEMLDYFTGRILAEYPVWQRYS